VRDREVLEIVVPLTESSRAKAPARLFSQRTACPLPRAPRHYLVVIEISFGHLAANLLPLDSHNSTTLRAARVEMRISLIFDLISVENQESRIVVSEVFKRNCRISHILRSKGIRENVLRICLDILFF